MYQVSPKGNRVGSQVQAMIGMLFYVGLEKVSPKKLFLDSNLKEVRGWTFWLEEMTSTKFLWGFRLLKEGHRNLYDGGGSKQGWEQQESTSDSREMARLGTLVGNCRQLEFHYA